MLRADHLQYLESVRSRLVEPPSKEMCAMAHNPSESSGELCTIVHTPPTQSPIAVELLAPLKAEAKERQKEGNARGGSNKGKSREKVPATKSDEGKATEKAAREESNCQNDSLKPTTNQRATIAL